jgi:hypothetical protein
MLPRGHKAPAQHSTFLANAMANRVPPLLLDTHAFICGTACCLFGPSGPGCRVSAAAAAGHQWCCNTQATTFSGRCLLQRRARISCKPSNSSGRREQHSVSHMLRLVLRAATASFGVSSRASKTGKQMTSRQNKLLCAQGFLQHLQHASHGAGRCPGRHRHTHTHT